MDPKRELLRHVLATLAYRGGKTIRGASKDFALFGSSETGKAPIHILSHLGDLMDWTLSLSKGQPVWHNATPLSWNLEVERFFSALQKLDDYLQSEAPLESSIERLFQGPLADALTHVGQLAMLRRMAGEPTRGENYFVAEMAAGRVGLDQADAVREFS